MGSKSASENRVFRLFQILKILKIENQQKFSKKSVKNLFKYLHILTHKKMIKNGDFQNRPKGVLKAQNLYAS